MEPYLFKRIPPEYRHGIHRLFCIHYPKAKWKWIKEDHDTHPHLVASGHLKDLAHAYILGREASWAKRCVDSWYPINSSQETSRDN